MYKLSIIVPVYNVRKYLDRCINSVYSQTFSDWELILVDDGSTDGSADLCDQWGSLDRKIKVIHQSNAGLSAARNTGLKNISGEYVAFIDSDDFLIDENTYQNAIDALSNDDSIDIVQFGFSLVDENGSIINYYRCDTTTYYGTKEYFSNFANICSDSSNSIKAPVWMRMYRSQLFDYVRFKEGVLFEDAFFDADIFSYSRGIRLINKGNYGYVCNPSSIMGSAISHKKANDAIWSNIHVYIGAKNAGLDQQLLCNYYFKIFHEMCCVNHIYGIQFDRQIFDSIDNLIPKSKIKNGYRSHLLISVINITGSYRAFKIATTIMAFKRIFHIHSEVNNASIVG